ncbi:MAG: LytTR family transcriptional regulator DNA-binding domain-containing protein [Sphingomonadales bacterium]|nr:LytTR family transcriptional regulator DNA-binding domain-containing protein [Sphingomonadales bacterium]
MAKRLTIELLIMVALGLLIGLLGPFGTFDAPPAQRMVSWVIWILSGYILFRPTGIVARWLCEATGMPRYTGTLLALVVASVPLTLVITMMAMRMDFGEALRWPGFWTMYLYIWVVSAVVSTATNVLLGRGAPVEAGAAAPSPLAARVVSSPAPEPTPTLAPEPAALTPALPLPPGFGTVRALKGEDHYIRVIGDGREEMILMRMRDAIDRLGAAEGLRVHRSWWVAKAAVAGMRRDGRTAILTLTGGHEVPVARDMMPHLRAAGWL